MSAEMVVAMGTAAAAVIAAVGTLIVSIRNGKKIEATSSKIQEIHVLVNSRMTDALRQISELSTRVAFLTGDKADADRARDAKTNIQK